MKKFLFCTLFVIAALCRTAQTAETEADSAGISAEAAAGGCDSASFLCEADSPGCLLLQAVMTGSFADFDGEDTLSCRVFSAVFPLMSAISETDIEHYLDEFGGDEDDVRDAYYAALANCLRAVILFEGTLPERRSAEQKVLMLFLEPAGEVNAEAEMAEIRERIDDKTIKKLADAVSVGEAFVRWLIEGDTAKTASQILPSAAYL